MHVDQTSGETFFDITDSFVLYDDFLIDIESGSNHSIALTDSGRIFVWGNNSKYQLAVDDPNYIRSSPMDVTEDIYTAIGFTKNEIGKFVKISAGGKIFLI